MCNVHVHDFVRHLSSPVNRPANPNDFINSNLFDGWRGESTRTDRAVLNAFQLFYTLLFKVFFLESFVTSSG